MEAVGRRVIVTAFDGWNDAGEAASTAIELIRESGEYELVHAVDPELYFDYQYTRPSVRMAGDGTRGLHWPTLWQLYTKRGIHAVRVPIRDFDRRDLASQIEAGLAALDALLDAHDKVYLHCTVGLNRSPTLALAHLYRTLGEKDALAALMERHPRAVPYPDSLTRWWKRRAT